MDVADTNPQEKCCSRCCIKKNVELFIPKRNICKECRNSRTREKYKALEINNDTQKECNVCNIIKIQSLDIVSIYFKTSFSNRNFNIVNDLLL